MRVKSREADRDGERTLRAACTSHANVSANRNVDKIRCSTAAARPQHGGSTDLCRRHEPHLPNLKVLATFI